MTQKPADTPKANCRKIFTIGAMSFTPATSSRRERLADDGRVADGIDLPKKIGQDDWERKAQNGLPARALGQVDRLEQRGKSPRGAVEFFIKQLPLLHRNNRLISSSEQLYAWMRKIVKRKALRRLVKIDNRKHANLCKTTASNSHSKLRGTFLGIRGKMTGTFWKFRLKNEGPFGIIKSQ